MGRSMLRPYGCRWSARRGAKLCLTKTLRDAGATEADPGTGRWRKNLVADDGDFGGGDFEALEAVVFVEIEHHFEVGGGDAEAVVGFAVRSGDRASGFYGDRPGSKFLGDEDGHGLRAAFGPIVDAGDHGVLIVEIVVEHSDERRAEAHVLFEGPRA